MSKSKSFTFLQGIRPYWKDSFKIPSSTQQTAGYSGKVKDKTEKTIKIIRVILIIIPILIFFFLINKHFSPLGKLELVYNFNKEDSPFFSRFSPNAENIEKDIINKQYYQRIIGGSTKFTINMPRLFKKAKLEIKYQNPQSILMLSALKKSEDKEYLTKTLENQIIEKSDWLRFEDPEKGMILLQQGKLKDTDNNGSEDKPEIEEEKEYQFQNIDQFLENIPVLVEENQKIAYSNYDLVEWFKISDYQKSDDIITFDKVLRGHHEILTYLGQDEDLNFTFYFEGKKAKENSDPDQIKVLKNKKVIFQKVLQEEEIKGKKPVDLKISQLGAGLLLIELDINSNLYLKKMETKQHLFAFADKLTLADPNQNSLFYTNASHFSVKTNHKTGLQTIKVGDKDLRLKEKHKYFDINLDQEINEVSIPKNDLSLKFPKSYFAFNEKCLEALKINYQSYVTPLTPMTDLNQIDFIISEYYEPPKKEGDWKIASQTFDLRELNTKDNKLKFSLIIPNFDRNRGDIKVSELKVVLEKDVWTLDFLVNKFKQLLKK